MCYIDSIRIARCTDIKRYEQSATKKKDVNVLLNKNKTKKKRSVSHDI